MVCKFRFVERIPPFVKNIIESLGLSTRVIDLAIQDETLTYMSERDEIAELVINKIKERPLTGWGSMVNGSSVDGPPIICFLNCLITMVLFWVD